MNLSLMLNHVGVYQLAKLAVIPTCAIFEYFLNGKVQTTAKIIAMTCVIIGVLTACVPQLLIEGFAGSELCSPPLAGPSQGLILATPAQPPLQLACFHRRALMWRAQP